MQEEIIKYKIEVFSISETKLDIYFPISQFIIKGYGAPFTGEAYYFTYVKISHVGFLINTLLKLKILMKMFSQKLT